MPKDAEESVNQSPLIKIVHHAATRGFKGAASATMTLLATELREGTASTYTLNRAADILEALSQDPALSKKMLGIDKTGRERTTESEAKRLETAMHVYDSQQAGHPLNANLKDPGAFYHVAVMLFGDDPSDAQIEYVRRCWDDKKVLVKQLKAATSEK